MLIPDNIIDKIQMTSRKRISLAQAKIRLLIVIFVVLCISATLISRLAMLTIFTDRNMNDDKETWTPYTQVINKERNLILDRNDHILAVTTPSYDMFIDAYSFLQSGESRNKAIKKLHKLFPDLKTKTLRRKINKKYRFVKLKTKLTPTQRDNAMLLAIPGLEFLENKIRIYPQKSLFSHILGFTNSNNVGVAGLEKSLNKQLTDKQNKKPLKLSVDLRVQNIIHEELLRTMLKFQAKSASAIVMDITNGEILSMVSLPDFNPNHITRKSMKNTFNNVTYGLFELGSVFKAITAAIAIDSKKVSLEERFETGRSLRIGPWKIHDFHAKHYPLSIAEIMAFSSNIGIARVALQTGADTFVKYLDQLNLTSKIDFDIDETIEPLLPKRWSKTAIITASYGHGLAITPLHLAKAYAIILNGGKLIQPTLIHNNPKNKHLQQSVFSPQTSFIMKNILRQIVHRGTARKANLVNYGIVAKTGTAELSIEGRYIRKEHDLSSLMAVFPYEKPRYLVYAMFNSPIGTIDTYGYATAGYVAAPAVRNMIAHIAPILNIQPHLSFADDFKLDNDPNYHINTDKH